MIYREVARKLARMGCQEIPRRSGGAHRKWRNPALTSPFEPKGEMGHLIR